MSLPGKEPVPSLPESHLETVVPGEGQGGEDWLGSGRAGVPRGSCCFQAGKPEEVLHLLSHVLSKSSWNQPRARCSEGVLTSLAICGGSPGPWALDSRHSSAGALRPHLHGLPRASLGWQARLLLIKHKVFVTVTVVPVLGDPGMLYHWAEPHLLDSLRWDLAKLPLLA